MKAYYLGGVCLAVLLFIILFAITGIAGCTESNKMIDEVEKAEKNTVVIRYYDNDNTDIANVYYLRINKKDREARLVIPTKKGYTFAGYYDGPDPLTAEFYADANGNIVVTPQDSILLYPVFEEISESEE